MRINILLLAILISINSCRAYKEEMIQTGGKKEAIKNAILDFSNSSRLYKTDSVFSVSFQNPLHRMILEETDDGNSRWVEGEPYKGIVAVSIIASYNKMLLTDSTQVGSIGKLPSRYIEKEGKLFYWWDDNYPLEKEALAVFDKYGLLQDDEGGWVKFPDFSTNDAKKGVHYYFCENDLTRYKKVTTDIAIGYYEAPNLNCSSQ